MSDAFQPLSQGIEMTVSIPAMPGQHVGHQKGLNIVKHDEGGFNPRDAGAACRTVADVDGRMVAVATFQSPRCRGSMSDPADQYRGVYAGNGRFNPRDA